MRRALRAVKDEDRERRGVYRGARLSRELPENVPGLHALTRNSSDALDYGTGLGFVFQMSAAYSAMVRSLEKRPEAPMFRSALRAQTLRSE